MWDSPADKPSATDVVYNRCKGRRMGLNLILNLNKKRIPFFYCFIDCLRNIQNVKSFLIWSHIRTCLFIRKIKWAHYFRWRHYFFLYIYRILVRPEKPIIATQNFNPRSRIFKARQQNRFECPTDKGPLKHIFLITFFYFQ
jgi:hypothetical protein